MNDGRTGFPLAPAIPAPPEALARETWILDPPAPSERRDVLRPEAAALVDGLLARVARGQGALDVAIGEVLAELAQGDRLLRLGFSCLGDYARERLDLGETAARNLARLARTLRGRPLLREAVRSGAVSARKAQAVLAVALGDDEAAWVGRARAETVRALDAAVRAARSGEATAPATTEDRWERVHVELAPPDRERLDRAMSLAGRVLGATSPRWQRLEAICEEYLGAFPSEPADGEAAHPEVRCGAVADRLDSAKEGLEQEMNRWDFLEPVPSVRAPIGDEDLDAGVARLDARSRELAQVRGRWGLLLGHLAMLIKNVGRAEAMTVIELRRLVEAGEGTQKCARGELDLRVPREVRILVDAVVRTVRARGTGLEGAGACLGIAAAHFADVWERSVRRPRTRSQKALERDRGYCTVPGCSRAAAHAHHVVRRSAGGSDELANLTSLCASHHLHGVHGGRIRVRGDAPGGLSWEMPAPPGGSPVWS